MKLIYIYSSAYIILIISLPALTQIKTILWDFARRVWQSNIVLEIVFFFQIDRFLRLRVNFIPNSTSAKSPMKVYITLNNFFPSKAILGFAIYNFFFFFLPLRRAPKRFINSHLNTRGTHCTQLISLQHTYKLQSYSMLFQIKCICDLRELRRTRSTFSLFQLYHVLQRNTGKEKLKISHIYIYMYIH